VIPVSRLLEGSGSAAAAVSFGRDPVACPVGSEAPEETAGVHARESARDAGQFLEDVRDLTAALAPSAGLRVLLHCEDVYAFAVGLFAIAHAGACAVLPPSRQAGALADAASGVSALVLDGSDVPARDVSGWNVDQANQ